MKTTKPQFTPKHSLISVEVLLPEDFVQEFTGYAENSNVTLAEAIRYVAETLLPQQFEEAVRKETGREGDTGLEMIMLRQILGTRSKETIA